MCGGKGGWKVETKHWTDNDWMVCPFCEGLSFHDELFDDKKDQPLILVYNAYKRVIIKTMDKFCKVLSYQTTDKCKKIEIVFASTSKERGMLEFVKELLRFGSFNSRLGIEGHQAFEYSKKDGEFYYHWKITLYPTVISDLDGFIDFITIWDHMYTYGNYKFNKGGKQDG